MVLGPPPLVATAGPSYLVGMKAHLLGAALLLGAVDAAAKVPVPQARPEPPIRIIVALPQAPDEEEGKLLAQAEEAATRLLGRGKKLSFIGTPGDKGAKKVWTAPRWSPELPEEERAQVLEELRGAWGDKLTITPALPVRDPAAPARPKAPARPDARDERVASFDAAGQANATLAERFAAGTNPSVAFDNAGERVNDALSAVPTANLPAFGGPPSTSLGTLRPDPLTPVTADGQTPAPATTAPPPPKQEPAPAVGQAAKDACAPLRGKGSKPNSSMDDILAQEAKCTGVSPDVIKALIAAKGGNKRNPLVVTRGAADWVGVGGDLNDPRTSVRAGALLLAKLYKFYNGDLNRALAAYEVGITAVTRSGGIPNNKSVKHLLGEFQRAYRKDGDKPVIPETPPEHPNLRRVEEEVKNVLTGPQLAPRVSFSATAPWRKMILEASRIYGVDPALIEAVMLSESGGNPKDHSTAGAKGLMQLMPETARYMGVKNIWDPRQNINGGTRYLKEMLDRFNGNTVLAVAAYNAGPNRDSLRGGKVPTIVETVYYTTRVFHRYAQLTGTEVVDFSSRLTAKGKRLYDRESARLEKLWGPTPETVPVPTPRPVAR